MRAQITVQAENIGIYASSICLYAHCRSQVGIMYSFVRASLIAQLVKNLPAMQEIPIQFLGWEDRLEKQ